MGVNDLSFNQLATTLNSIQKQATGKNALTATNTADFVSAAQTTLRTGYDPVMNAISQVLGKTIFSIRPYSRKFKGLEMSSQRWGYCTRKLSLSDVDFEDDERIPLDDGDTVDMYEILKPNPLETHLYGQNVFSKRVTIFKDQLDCAFQSPEEFAQFLTMVTTNSTDMIEQARENIARATVSNFIAGKTLNDSSNVIHLLTEYNTLTGQSLTATTVFLPANFQPFMQFVYARIGEISAMLTERTTLFHQNVTAFGSDAVDKTIARHTPVERQKVYLYAPMQLKADAAVLANTYHDNYLKKTDFELVSFWQSAQSKDTINITPVVMDNTGEVSTGTAVSQANVFGIIFDEDAMGYTLMNQWTSTTPLNSRGGYWNWYFHETQRSFVDYTENAVVFLLD